jgi:hypothetical protein
MQRSMPTGFSRAWVGWTLALAMLSTASPLWGGDGSAGATSRPQVPAAAAPEGGAGSQGREGRGGRDVGGGRGGGAGSLAPIPFGQRTGFQPIFDGKTLNGWDGDPTFWRVENGAIVGESTASRPVTQNTFLIWRGGEPADFELKLEFRINSTNSGVQYRSQQLPEAGEGQSRIGKWVLKGYQADIDFNNQYTGMLYEERGREFLARRGMLGYVGPNQPPAGRRGQAATPAPGSAAPGPRGRLGQLADDEALKAHINQNDWNQFHVIARGNVLIHVLNDHVTMVFVDDDAANRAMKGLIGLQMHTGAPMKVEFRDIFLKTL